MYDVCAPAPVLCGRALRLSAFDIALLQAILANRLKADFYKRSQCAPDAHCQPAGDRLKSQHVSGSAFGHLGRSGPAHRFLPLVFSSLGRGSCTKIVRTRTASPVLPIERLVDGA
jgi:hypothetical protein